MRPRCPADAKASGWTPKVLGRGGRGGLSGAEVRGAACSPARAPSRGPEGPAGACWAWAGVGGPGRGAYTRARRTHCEHSVSATTALSLGSDGRGGAAGGSRVSEVPAPEFGGSVSAVMQESLGCR